MIKFDIHVFHNLLYLKFQFVHVRCWISEFLLSEQTNESFISEVKIIDDNTVICCLDKSGEIILIDLRCKKRNDWTVDNKSECKKDLYWTMDVTNETLYRLSSAGCIIASDLRNGDNNVLKKVEIELQTNTYSAGLEIKVCFLYCSPPHKHYYSGFKSYF